MDVTLTMSFVRSVFTKEFNEGIDSLDETGSQVNRTYYELGEDVPAVLANCLSFNAFSVNAFSMTSVSRSGE